MDIVHESRGGISRNNGKEGVGKESRTQWGGIGGKKTATEKHMDR